MARAKRNNNALQSAAQKSVADVAVVQTAQITTAIYARLSAENSHKSDETDVIANQIAGCEHYIAEHADLTLVETYVDNGESGTKFDRPAFNRLMQDIRTGKIKCIVVRDLSRFGRDYIETGTYLERVFPSLNVRFIAINEQYDSFGVQGQGESLMIPLQNMINNLYAKDISRKVFTAHRTRMTAGSFKRSTLPYGYMLDETRCQVLVDEVAAPYVRLLFQWKLEGVSIRQMIEQLEQLGAPNARQRKAETGVQGGDVSKNSGWHFSTIQNMLHNHTYIGHTVIGKKVRSYYKGVRCKTYKDPEDWIVIENTHPAIVSVEDFEAVQALFAEGSNRRQASMTKTAQARAEIVNVLQGKIFCADCMSPMTLLREHTGKRLGGRYKCLRYQRKKECTKHSMQHKVVEAKVLAAIQLQVKASLSQQANFAQQSKSEAEQQRTAQCNAQLARLTLQRSSVQKKRTRLYEDFVDGVLSEEEYAFAKKTYADEYEQLEKDLAQATQQRTAMQALATSQKQYHALMKSFGKLKKLTPAICDAMVEKVLVHEGGDVEVVMKYHDVYTDVAAVALGQEQKGA